MTGTFEHKPGTLTRIADAMDTAARELHPHATIPVPGDLPGLEILKDGKRELRKRVTDCLDWAQWMAEECRASHQTFVSTEHEIEATWTSEHGRMPPVSLAPSPLYENPLLPTNTMLPGMEGTPGSPYAFPWSTTGPLIPPGPTETGGR